MPGGRDHYCFIIHANRPYCYDMNPILALPSGFRYQSRYAGPSVEDSLLGDINVMIGSDVLIVLAVQERNSLIPVRWGNIKEAQKIGSICYFEYLLGDLVEYSSDYDKRNQEIVRATKLFADARVWSFETTGETLLKPAVFQSAVGSSFRSTRVDDLAAWGNTVEAVSTASAYENAEFLDVLGLFDPKGKQSPVKNGHYVIRPNTVYQLKLFQYIPAPGAMSDVISRDINIATFPDHFVSLRPGQRAVGKYDMLTFSLKSRRLRSKERSAIEVGQNPVLEGSRSCAPETLYLPITIKGRSSVVIVLWILILATCLIGIFAPKFYYADSALVRNLAIVIFVLAVSGRRLTWP